jgi:predicted RNase H-like HicB family nuclease
MNNIQIDGLTVLLQIYENEDFTIEFLALFDKFPKIKAIGKTKEEALTNLKSIWEIEMKKTKIENT